MASPAFLAVAPCFHEFCNRNMIALPGSLSSEGSLFRQSGVQSHLCHGKPRRKFEFQVGRIRCPRFSALQMNSKTSTVRAAEKNEAGDAGPGQGAKKAVGANNDTTPVAKVTFQMKHQVHFGQEFCVVGSSLELGQWDLQAALPLTWTEGHIWTADKAVGVGQTIEYKFVLTSSDGGVEWQLGENRIFETKSADDLLVSVPWIPSDDVSSEVLGDVPPEAVLEAGEHAPPEAVPEVTADVPPEAAAGFDNGVAPGTDAVEGILASVDLLVDNVKKSAADVLPSSTKKFKDSTGENGIAEEPSELPAVDAIVATAVAEASGTAEVLAGELAAQSGEIVEQPQVEADDSSSGPLRAHQEEGTGESSQQTELATEAPAEVEQKVESPEPLSSTKAILDNDLQWFSRRFGSKP